MRSVAVLICSIAVAALPAVAVAAPKLTTLYTFSGGADGGSPGAGLLPGWGGELYGTTESGGIGGNGTVFRLAPPGPGTTQYTLTTLHSFAGGTDGVDPTNLVADWFGNLYGVTSAGGGSAACSGGCGTVFQLRPPGPGHSEWTETVIHAFDGEEGRFPSGLAMDLFGNLYGFTWGGAGTCSGGCGTVYRLSPQRPGRSNWNYQRLYTFSDQGDGKGPFGIPAIGLDGTIYGLAYSGGPGAPAACAPFVGCGEAFKLSPPSPWASADTPWTKSAIWYFSGSDGTGAFNSLTLDWRGHLIGMTNEGGHTDASCQSPGITPGCGVAFELVPPAHRGGAWSQKVIWQFTGGLDAGYPANSKPVPVFGGYLATTSGGNVAPGLYGALVKFLPPTPANTAWTEQTLYTFSNDVDGAVPLGVLLPFNGAVYGTTFGSGSGPAAAGTVYKFTP